MEYSKHLGLKLPSRDIDDAADIDVISRNFEEIDRLLGEDFLKKTEILQVYDPASREPISATAVAGAISGAAPNIAYDSSIFEGVLSVADELKKLEEDSDLKNNQITAANVRIDNVENDLYYKTEWKTLSAGTLSEGGVASIKAELTGDVSNIREMNFYLFFKATEEMNGKTAYLNANINGTTLTNLICYTTSVALKSGYNHKLVSQIKVVKANDGYVVQSVNSKMNYNYGSNSSGNATNTVSDWIITEGATQNLTINISSTTFPSGTKWVLEGR